MRASELTDRQMLRESEIEFVGVFLSPSGGLPWFWGGLGVSVVPALLWSEFSTAHRAQVASCHLLGIAHLVCML